MKLVSIKLAFKSDSEDLDRFSYLVPNEFTCESDPGWNCTAPWWYRDHVNTTQFRRTRAAPELI